MKVLPGLVKGFVPNTILQRRTIKKPCAIITIILLKPKNDMIGHEPAKKKKKRITPLQLSPLTHLQLSESQHHCIHQEQCPPRTVFPPPPSERLTVWHVGAH